MKYAQFVKEKMPSVRHLKPKERMAEIGKMWKKSKGGILESSAPAQAQAQVAPAKDAMQAAPAKEAAPTKQAAPPPSTSTDPYGDFKGISQVPPQDLLDLGLPPMIAIHPNKYSANPNLVMVYNSTDDFLNSSFYEKYKKKMKLVKAITSFGADDVGATQTRAKDIPGKRLRIIFRSSSYTDNNQYMLDPKDADEYLEVLSAAKDSHILLPVEFYAMFNLKRFAKDRQEQVSQNIETWHKGYAWGEYYGFGEGHEKGYKEGHEAGYQEGYKQKQSEESSSGWSDVLGTVASVGLKLLL